MQQQAGARHPFKKSWVWAAQTGLAVLVVWFVWRSAAGNLTQFRSLDVPLQFHLQMIVPAAFAVWLAYALLIIAWRTVLGGWQQHLPIGSAIRIWCVSNLGRYLPGKLWSIAGLAVLAQREGVHGWAAAASALAMQALSLGTGAGVVIAFLPQAGSPALLIAAIAVAVASIAALTLKPMVGALARVTRGKLQLQPLPATAVLIGAGATLSAWVLYGMAFRLLALGIVPASAPSLPLAMGAFTGAYIVGLFSIFAPGGVVIRELMLVGFLAPTMGGGPALAVSIGSRLLWTFAEVVAAIVAMPLGASRGERV